MTPRAALCVLFLAGLAAAQTGVDPRKTDDPRDVPDPRESQDPREAATAKDPRGVPSSDPFSKLEGRELYDALYKAGNDGRLGQAFKENGWQILGYIDSHCEGWLAMLESGEDQTDGGREKMAAMQAKGKKLATLADKVLVDTRFTAYVTNFYGWDAEQRKKFREGQALFRQAEQIISEAKAPDAMLAALTPLNQSLDRSRPLSDTWGQSMAHSLIGRVQRANGQNAAAIASLNESRRLGREIRDLASVWEALAAQYEMAFKERKYAPAKDALQEQYLVALDMKDELTQNNVTQKLVELEHLLGK